MSRFVSIAAAAIVAGIGFFAPGSAAADVVVPLPDGYIEGPGVKITSRGERAIVSPSLAVNGAGRSTWVSGNVTAEVQTPDGEVGPNNGPRNFPGTNNSGTHGSSNLTVGYIVGCQVALGSFSGSTSVGISTTPSLSVGFSFPLSPGEVKWVAINNIELIKSGTYDIQYQDVPMEIQGCGGYAQARQVSVVEIIGTDYAKVTLYGQPFSIG
ncbi:MspA family porin [Nocardia otitidiscaviarum]|uniref:MspA family porin n=1 Tax=Nocardia otitidiscaviarum TaxID=1823 RepID=UPI0004A742CD|nr:MspA family porin [Nocardia otitidiscaviarum]MBF6133455.1 MspA family porin [Nocardia otitidiscaviarum]MBF6487538.1 MspA family porin [Nocardia otitidiscaviarum]